MQRGAMAIIPTAMTADLGIVVPTPASVFASAVVPSYVVVSSSLLVSLSLLITLTYLVVPSTLA